ncbi:MAG TPA: methylmalonyl-CoA epimerase [bacterium]|nr:methylmalonyl-CoA epimerase [bacterium]
MRVAHIAIAVPDLAEAQAKWTALLGQEPHTVEHLPNQGVTSVSYHLDNLVIELVTPLGDHSPIAGYLAKRGPGIHHVAFETTDLAATLAAKQVQGFEVIPPREGPGAGGTQVTFLHPRSMAGILVEFVQPPRPDPIAAAAEDHLRAGGCPVDSATPQEAPREHHQAAPAPEGAPRE